MSETVPSRLPVFVCYAHEDNDPKDPLSKRWLDRLLQQLSPLAIQDEVCAWSDKDIETGQDWHVRIQQTLENTKAAVLLVSPPFWLPNIFGIVNFQSFSRMPRIGA